MAYLLAHAAELGADRNLVTLGGSSVGGTLTLSTSQVLPPGTVKAWLGFCPPVDLRLRPRDKKRPQGFPERDPLAFLEPLWDVYAGAERERNREDARCHPTLARRGDSPRDLLFVCAGMDILLDEQMKFVEKLEREREGNGVLEVLVVGKGFHGFVECKCVSYPEFWTDADYIVPSWIMERERMEVFEKSIAFMKMVHEKHGFEFDHRKRRSQ